MATCDYCDRPLVPGKAKCGYCGAPCDPMSSSGAGQAAQHSSAGSRGSSGVAPVSSQASASLPRGAPPAAPMSGSAGPPPRTADLLQSLQAGDVNGVTRGLQTMAQSGQLDLGQLARDLGVQGSRGLDLGQVAQALTQGGTQSSTVLQALGHQGGNVGELLKGAAGALKSPAGLAVGGVALAAAGLGAGYLLTRAREGGGAAGISNTIGSLLGSSSSAPSAEDGARYTQLAEMLPPPSPDQLREGSVVLARWDGNEWRPAQVGWVDGGQARVTFENGLERWCMPADLRLPPTPGQSPPSPAASAPSRGTPTGIGFTVGARVQAPTAPGQWSPAEVTDTDHIGGRIRVKYAQRFRVLA